MYIGKENHSTLTVLLWLDAKLDVANHAIEESVNKLYGNETIFYVSWMSSIRVLKYQKERMNAISCTKTKVCLIWLIPIISNLNSYDEIMNESRYNLNKPSANLPEIDI